MELERNQIRAHLHWTGSNWVRPKNQKLVKSGFSSGTLVEYRGDLAWHVVMIVKELEKEKSFIVNHGGETLNNSNITVDSSRVRPLQPPSFPVGEYELLDRVEVYHRFVWCQGVVKGIVYEGRYMVSLEPSNKAFEFNHSDIRPLMEWKDGVWHKTPKESSEDNNRKRKREQQNTISVANVLPFEKKLPIWKTFESMEAFQTIPQNPHFSPLFDVRETSREMYAVGMMHTFAALLKDFEDLQLGTPVNTLSSLKDSFSELEEHGFEVKAPLSRINKLSSLKDTEEMKLEELKGAEKEVVEKEPEKDEIEDKILELQKRKEEAVKEIAKKKSCVATVNQELEDVGIQFQTTVSAPWNL